jgi:hypothetical protein
MSAICVHYHHVCHLRALSLRLLFDIIIPAIAECELSIGVTQHEHEAPFCASFCPVESLCRANMKENYALQRMLQDGWALAARKEAIQERLVQLSGATRRALNEL